MKYILTIFCVSAMMLLMPRCAKVNVFQEPPDHPVIDSLFPAAGFVGTQLRIWGSGFSTYSSKDTVLINGVLVRVDSPSTSTVLLATLIDSTGTGPVHVRVNGQTGVGPIFTYLGTNDTAEAPFITFAEHGWYDGSGYSITLRSLPSDISGLRAYIAGINLPIAEVTRPGTPNWDPALGYRLLLHNDEDITSHTEGQFAKFLVTYNGVPSNLYSYQMIPAIKDIFSGKGDFRFGSGDTVTIKGNYFGDRSIYPSSFYMLYNGAELPQPTILSWTNEEIRAIMPPYPGVTAPSIGVAIKVGTKMSYTYYCYYLGNYSGTISLVAGGDQGYGDGDGASAKFNTPVGLVVNAQGVLYVADQLNHRIRKITNITDAGGTVTTVAGSTEGFRDGGAADAFFDQPTGIALDENGDIYVADRLNNRIRFISGGIVSTFAGDGSITRMYDPSGIAMNNHNIAYVADERNNRVMLLINQNEVVTAGGIQGYADGTGNAARFSQPYGIALAASGNIYVADVQNHAIRKVTSAGVVTTLAGGITAGTADGVGTAAQFNYPVGVAVDAQENVYVADLTNTHIRKITPQGLVTTIVPLNSSGQLVDFTGPTGIAVDAQNNIYVADGGSHRIYRVKQ